MKASIKSDFRTLEAGKKWLVGDTVRFAATDEVKDLLQEAYARRKLWLRKRSNSAFLK